MWLETSWVFDEYAKRLIFTQLNFLWVKCDTFLGKKKVFRVVDTVGRDKKRSFSSNEMKITLVSCEDQKRRFISQGVNTLRFQSTRVRPLRRALPLFQGVLFLSNSTFFHERFVVPQIPLSSHSCSVFCDCGKTVFTSDSLKLILMVLLISQRRT